MTEWEQFVEDIMTLWRANNDTVDMAHATGSPEHVCAMALRVGREQQYMARKQLGAATR